MDKPKFVKAALVILTILLVTVIACNPRSLKRPPGYLRLGSVAELAKSSEVHFSEYRIFLKRDERGFYAMSTACTYDLSALMRISGQGQDRWKSSFTTSEYALDGDVLRGPATASLPYYDLRIAAGDYGGAPDTLFVEVGVERSKDWRLVIP